MNFCVLFIILFFSFKVNSSELKSLSPSSKIELNEISKILIGAYFESRSIDDAYSLLRDKPVQIWKARGSLFQDSSYEKDAMILSKTERSILARNDSIEFRIFSFSQLYALNSNELLGVFQSLSHFENSPCILVSWSSDGNILQMGRVLNLVFFESFGGIEIDTMYSLQGHKIVLGNSYGAEGGMEWGSIWLGTYSHDGQFNFLFRKKYQNEAGLQEIRYAHSLQNNGAHALIFTETRKANADPKEWVTADQAIRRSSE